MGREKREGRGPVQHNLQSSIKSSKRLKASRKTRKNHQMKRGGEFNSTKKREGGKTYLQKKKDVGKIARRDRKMWVNTQKGGEGGDTTKEGEGVRLSNFERSKFFKRQTMGAFPMQNPAQYYLKPQGQGTGTWSKKHTMEGRSGGETR